MFTIREQQKEGEAAPSVPQAVDGGHVTYHSRNLDCIFNIVSSCTDFFFFITGNINNASEYMECTRMLPLAEDNRYAYARI